MNEKKFCFIRCVNNDVYSEEQNYYISSLNIPEGFEVEVISVSDAVSMCSGYNEAMNASDAKYKIYIHQDVFILETDILYKLLEIFSDSSIGMIGVIGNEKLDVTSIPWNSEKCGKVCMGFGNHTNTVGESFQNGESYRVVQVIDGLFMATQVDVLWREDICTNFDMYDLSQSFEMRRKGYKVVVPNIKEPWVIHDEDINNLKNYYKSLDSFRKEYKKELIDQQEEKSKKIDMLIMIPEGGTQDIYDSAKYICGHVETCERVLAPNKSDYNDDYVYLSHYYGEREIGVVFSALFLPVVAKFCYEKGIKYISWIYDSPQQALYYPEIEYTTNHVFVFDKTFMGRIGAIGCKKVYYQPCGSNVERAKRITNMSETVGYKYDVSFVGQLYNYDDINKFDSLIDEKNGGLNFYYEKEKCNWFEKREWPHFPEELMGIVDKASVPVKMDSSVYYGTAVMSRKLAQIERIEVLNYLAKKNEVFIFTNSDTAKLEKVNVMGPAEYYTESPLVFRYSKINLNITLPSIETGVPWRVFDIMAAGGFVLSNYQKEIEDLFEIGKEIEVFRSLEELEEKVEYYLSHDKEREEIAKNSFIKVKEKYNLTKTIEAMYKKVVG